MAHETILVVEDEQIVASDLKMILEALGYRVPKPLSTAEDALALIPDIRPDLVFMDVVLAGLMDGIEAAEQIRTRFQIPVIYITAYTDSNTLERARITEPFGYIIKPFDEKELESALTIALYKSRIDAQLRESEKKYRTLIENTLDVIYSYDEAGIVTYISPQIEKYGYTVEEVVGHSLFEFVHPEDHTLVQADMARTLQHGEEFPSIFRIQDKRGVIHWIEERGKGQRDADGNLVSVSGILRDITQQKEAEEVSRKSQEKYRDIFNGADFGLIFVGRDGKVGAVNPAFIRITGIPREEVEGKSPFALVRKFVKTKDLPEILASVKRLFAGERISAYEIEYRGKVIEIQSQEEQFTDGYTVVFRDVTESKRTQERLIREKERAQMYLDLAGVMMLALDREGKIAVINRRGCEILGVSEEEALGKDWVAQFIPENIQDETRKIFHRIISGRIKKFDYAENLVRTQSGETRIIAWHNTLIRDEKNKIVGTLSSGEDITERRQAEEELQKLADVIHHSSELVNLITLDRKMIFLNEAGSKILGISPSEVAQTDVMEVLPPHSREIAEKELFPTLLKTGHWTGELQYLNLKTGQVVDVLATAFVIKHPTSGSPQYFANVSLDITEQKKAREALRQSEAQLANAVSLARLGPWEYDVAKDLFTFNDPFYAIFRTTAEEVGGYTMPSAEYAKRFVHPDDMAMVGIETRKALETSDPNYRSDVEHRIIYADGEEGYIAVRIFIDKDNQGRTVRTFGVNQDITDRKRIELELQKHEKQLEEAQRIGRIGSWEWDAASNNAICSNELYTILDIDPNISKFTVETFLNTPHPEDRTKVQEIIMRSIETNQPTDFYFRRIIKNGELRWIHAKSSVSVDENENLVKVSGTLQDVTERKRAEEELRESEEKYRSLIDNMNEGIFISDCKGRITFANKALAQIHGYDSPDELLNRKFTDFFEPSMRDEHVQRISTEMQSGEIPSHIENLPIIKADSSVAYVQVYPRPIYQGERIVGTMGIVQDITERRRAEADLLASEKKYRSIFENVQDVYYETLFDGTIVELSPSIAAISKGQYHREDLIGKSMLDFYADPKDRDILLSILKKDGEVNDFEVRLRNRDGSLIWVSVAAKTSLSAEGGKGKILGSMHDITERKRAEESLQSERNLLRTLIDNMPDKIYAKDRESRFIVCNKSLASRLGASDPAEVVGKTDFDFVPHDLAKMYRDDEQEIIKSGQSLINHEEPVDRPDGETRWNLATKVPLRDTEGKIVGVVGLGRDITERKRAEEELKRTSNELKNYVSELEQFAYISSHDLQEPVRQIVSFAQLLERRYAGKYGKEADDYAGFVHEGATRLQVMVDDMRGYFNLLTENRPFEKVSLDRVFKKVQGEMQDRIRAAGAHVSCSELPEVNGNPRQLHQLFHHLLDNAFKFHGPEPPDVRIRCKRQDAEWLFSIQDNGIGINPEYSEQIFKVFKKLHARGQYPGSGIGLSICKKVVEHHGGRIWIESQRECETGTTVYFTLPVS